MYKTIVVGGGTSGLACACFLDSNTLLLDRQEVGKKLSIAGNTRVNLTNLANLDIFLESYSPRGDFLRDAFKAFFRDDLINFINTLGLKTQVENGKVFLKDYNGKQLVERMKKYITGKKIKIHENERVIKIEKEHHFFVYTNKNVYESQNVVIATGGMSYNKLGSEDGYAFAQSFAHTIVPLKPFETPFCVEEGLFKDLSGITLQNIQIKYKNKIFRGNLLFTHFGLSGPLILDVSFYVNDGDTIYINFLGDNKDIFLKDLYEANNLKSAIKNYLPKRLLDNILNKMPFIVKNIAEISKRDLNSLFDLLFDYKIVVKLCGFNKAFVTKGGVALKEINPKTCESKLVSGLFFCGEVLDIAGKIGGFNIQAAFSTAYLVCLKIRQSAVKKHVKSD